MSKRHARTFAATVRSLSLGIVVLLFLVLASVSLGGTFVTFGPENFVRDTGKPVPVTIDFTTLNPSTDYTLWIDNGGLNDEFDNVSSAVITLNGIEVAGPSDFNQNVAIIEKAVVLLAANELVVEVRSKPGSGFALQIIGVDNDPPTITATAEPPPNAADWNNTDVTVSFDCADATSGISSCSDPVTVDTEGADQVITGTAVDNAENEATASVTLDIDKTLPNVAITSLANDSTVNVSDVTVEGTADDALSGIASVTCNTSTASVTGTIWTCDLSLTAGANTLVVEATDIAGNTATTSITVSFAIPVPDVVGLAQTDAEAAIVAVGLTVGAVTTANNDTVPAGDVISQSPAAGTEVAPGTAVDLVVSLGPPPVAVPDVVGLPQAAAEAAIVAATLVVGTVTTANNDTVPAGDVISQSPAAGTSVPEGSAIDLEVSLGPAVVAIPDVIGLSQAAAEAAIVAASLTVGNITTSNSPTIPAGDVISQSPVAGVQVTPGTPVDMVVSLGNNPPSITSAPITTATEDQLYTYDVEATDPDTGDVLTFSLDVAPAGMTIDDTTGLIQWTPTNAQAGNQPVSFSFLGPTPYLSFADSPYANLLFDYFHLEDFEDGVLNTPGVTASVTHSAPGNIFSDSVDADDGTIDGSGNQGGSLAALAGPAEIIFTFDSGALGTFPTHVGIVWTDAEGPRTTNVFLEAFDASGSFLGVFGPHVLGRSPTTGETDEDRFIGMINPNGISTIRIFQDAAQMEVDHLQYGRFQGGGNPVTVRVDDTGGLFDTQSFTVTVTSLLVTVPDVVGLPQTNAEAAIVAANLVVGAVSTANSDTVPTGDVISQSPAAGAEVTPGTAVDLVVSLGPALIPVPDVVGLTQAAAQAALVAANLTVGAITTANSPTVPAGDVISQSPVAGTHVTPGTSVEVVVSLGNNPPSITSAPITTATEGQLYTYDVEATSSLNDGLVAFFPFNANANDESGNGNHGTVFGATLSTDRFGNPDSAYSFDGINDFIKASAVNLPTGERSVSLWFEANTVANHPVLLSYGGGLCGTSWFMGINATKNIYNNAFYITSHCDVNNLIVPYAQDPINKWHHWVVTTDATGTTMYIDGEAVGSNANFITNTNVIGRDLAFGVATSPSGVAPYTDINVDYHQGNIDDIRIYNRSLSENEIRDLANVLTFSLDVAPAGMTIDPVTGLIQWTPDSSQVGETPVTVRVEDTGGLFDTQSFTITVASLLVTVPDVVGLLQADAESAITGAGLTVGAITTESSPTVPVGDVISQTPAGGSSVALGSSVNMVVSSGPPQAIVPDVVGLPQANAEAAIVAASLVVGAVSTATSDTVPAGDVISQTPVAGTSVSEGSAVDLVVSLGPAPVAVPDVVGLSQSDAEAAIVAANLIVGAITTANSPTVPAGDVISQSPVAGTQVAAGTSVDVVVSLGNDPPTITSTPITSANVGELYSYDVEAIDPDVSDVLTFSLDVAPTGMTIDPVTGLIEWTPTTDQVGGNPITVRVEDIGDLFDTQSFTVTANNDSDNDGVVNDDDLCPGTSEGADVDSNGCSAEQLTVPVSIELGLQSNSALAGSSVTVQTIVRNAIRDIIDPPPAVDLIITALDSPTGPTPAVVGDTISIDPDTRGNFTVQSHITDPPLTDETTLTVLANTNQNEQMTILSESLNATATALSQALAALEANDLTAAAVARADLEAAAASLDFQLLEIAMPYAPEQGFFLPLDELTARGFPLTAADEDYSDSLDEILNEFNNLLDALEGVEPTNLMTAQIAALDARADVLSALVEQFEAISPSVHGVIANTSELTLLLTRRIPRFIELSVEKSSASMQVIGVAQVTHSSATKLASANSLQMLKFSTLLNRFIPFVGPRQAHAQTLTDIVVALHITQVNSIRLVQKVYGKALRDVAIMMVLTIVDNLLQSSLPDSNVCGAFSGLSSTAITPGIPGSFIEGTQFNLFSDLDRVYFIGPEAPQAVLDIVTGTADLNDALRKAGSLDDVFEKIKMLDKAFEGAQDAFENALKYPSSVTPGIGRLCTTISPQLVYDDGFPDVLGNCFVCISPIIIIHIDSGNGAASVFSVVMAK